VTALLAALGAALAVTVELVEALAIVVAVGVSRGWRDAFAGAAGAVVALAALGVMIGPVVLAHVALHTLRLVIGVLLLAFGWQWLRKGTLRLAGRRARSSAAAEYEQARRELAGLPLPGSAGADWVGRAVAFKGVLLEGTEVVVIVSLLAARPSGPAPALAGAAVAAIATSLAAVWLRRPLERLPETELKWAVGVLLTSFGIFFAGEGAGVEWPGADVAVVYVAALVATASQVAARVLGRARAA
jgi:uncharacterized membrane protein